MGPNSELFASANELDVVRSLVRHLEVRLQAGLADALLPFLRRRSPLLPVCIVGHLGERDSLVVLTLVSVRPHPTTRGNKC